MMANFWWRVKDLSSQAALGAAKSDHYPTQTDAKHLLIVSLAAGLAFCTAYALSTPGSGAHTRVASTASKSDRLHLHAPRIQCSRQIWPYYDRACLRDYRRLGSHPRAIRILPVDRLSAAKRSVLLEK